MEPTFNNQNPIPQATVFTPPRPPSRGLNTKSIILIGVLVLVLVGLILGFDKARSFLSKAAGEGGCEPENLRETNLAQTSVEIVFSTSKACKAEVNYGISQDGMLLQVPEAMASLNHRIRLSPLLPSTTYYYQVNVEGKKIEPARSFLTLVVPIPTQIPTSSAGYTFNDFSPYLGTANPTFDMDKNGVVNSADWLLYQGSKGR